MTASAIAAAFVAACRDELQAPKPGNVHVHAAGHRMTVRDFEDSATAAAAPLCATGTRVGSRIRAAVAATRLAVGTNTNLGIVLLCAPLAAATDLALEHPPETPPAAAHELRERVREVLGGLDVADAADAFAAIVEASPAGLGRAEDHDVFAPPTVTLAAAMAAASDRDRVARQYATGYADVFDLGVPAHRAAAARGLAAEFATLAVYLAFLSRFPDSHIGRKHGAAAAERVMREARDFDTRLGKVQNPAGVHADLLPGLLAWDHRLKDDGLNPGTTADLTVATLFAIRLQSVLPSSHNFG